MKSHSIIIGITMLCLAGTSLQAVNFLNGCTKDKCVVCRQTTSTTTPYSRYCTRCKDSKLTIITPGVDQKCTGSDTTIKDCDIEMEDPNNAGSMICFHCLHGTYISANGKSCIKTTRGCETGAVLDSVAGETCTACKNDKKFVIEGTGTNLYAKCVDGGTKIEHCQEKLYNTPAGGLTAGVTVTQKCILCEEGYALDSTGKCIKLYQESHNMACEYLTPKNNQCDHCNWHYDFYATGTVKTAGATTTAGPGNGDQICFSGVLPSLAAFASFFLTFLRL